MVEQSTRQGQIYMVAAFRPDNHTGTESTAISYYVEDHLSRWTSSAYNFRGEGHRKTAALAPQFVTGSISSVEAD